jgi:hypothetical protein
MHVRTGTFRSLLLRTSSISACREHLSLLRWRRLTRRRPCGGRGSREAFVEELWCLWPVRDASLVTTGMRACSALGTRLVLPAVLVRGAYVLQ